MSIITEFDLLRHRRTKIVATLGPASAAPATVRALLEAGVDVVRLNMSHGDHAFHRAAAAAVREAAADLGRHVGLLADLSGPKIRVGRFQDGAIRLADGEAVTVTTRDVEGRAGLIPSQYAGLADDLRPGDRILLADGGIELETRCVEDTEIRCTVVHGGTLRDHQGINLPGVTVSAPSLTDKDRRDVRFALGAGVDFLALSFVRRAADVADLRALTAGAAGAPAIIAKIEKAEALAQMAGILAAADGIMIARGDLGVELPAEQVPIAQHQLVEQARAANKPVIVATQMLESMVTEPRPTRAEVTDVSHAVALGADAVMLSAETASGAWPVRAVQIMDRVARQTEAFFFRRRGAGGLRPAALQSAPVPFGDAVADAAAQLVGDLHARGLVAISTSGMSAATMSAARPAAPVVVVSADPAVCRRMSLYWGAIPVLASGVGHDNPNHLARRVARELGLAEAGQYVVLVRGFNRDPARNTPTITLLTV